MLQSNVIKLQEFSSTAAGMIENLDQCWKVDNTMNDKFYFLQLWRMAKEGKKKALYNASKVRSFHAAAGADTSIV